MQNGPYRGLKCTISHHEMGFIVLRNGQYRNVIFIVLDYVMGYIKKRYYTKCPLLYSF